MKTIGFVLPDLRGGGAERVFSTLVNHLNDHGTDVILILGEKKGPLLHSINDSIKVLELGKKGISSLFRLRKVVLEHKVDVIIGTLSMAYVVALSRFVLPRTCLLISRLGNTISEDLKNHKGIKSFIQKIYQFSLFFSDRIIVQSEYMQRDLYNILKFKKIKQSTHLIYNPINIDKVYFQSLNYEINPINSIQNCDVISVGRLESQKDHETTILAFSRYNSIHPSAKLHILGDGSLRLALESLVNELSLQNNVVFHGHVINPYPYIARSKMLVMSSLYEGFSNVILEALCLNIPVVVSNCPGGNSEIVVDYKNGFLFKTGSSEDMLAKMLLLDEHQLSGFNVSQYDVNSIAQRYLDLSNA